MKLAIVGDGKMGRTVAALAPGQGFEVVALLGEAEVRPGGLTRALLAGAEVAVEFTEAASAPANIRQCAAVGCPVVSGTTGWDAERAAVEADVRKAGGALLWAPNFALGVGLFLKIVEEAARRFAAAPQFDAHIVETHHAAKKDAPSGTAKRIAEIAAGPLGRPVPVTSIRTGQVPGTHAIMFDGPFEQVTLEHVARDRGVFASGALVAARWLAGKRGGGIFTLDDVLSGRSDG